MIQVDNISFKLNSIFDGMGQYTIYNNDSCIGDIVISGNTEIIDGTSLVSINETLLLNEFISIKFTDIKGCEICEVYPITILECTPFTGSAVYIDEDVLCTPFTGSAEYIEN